MQTNRDPSINGFCQRQQISRSHFYNLLARGQGPATYKIGKLIRISEAAEHAWVSEAERQAADANAATFAA